MKKQSLASDELFFILSPPKAVADYVAMLKSYVKSSIGHGFEDEFSKAHISLFKYRDAHAEDLLYQVDSKISSFTPFHVYLKDLNVFNHGATRTIYLEIVHKAPICEIFENIVERDVDFTPHLTIARNLEINDFLMAWKDLKNLSYSQCFRCDHITVLKKSPRKWIHYVDIPFAA
jgi:2'-5' RNA ligase